MNLTEQLQITALNNQCQGVARSANNAVVFVAGAIPGELVTAKIVSQKKSWLKAELEQIILPSNQRRAALCVHFSSRSDNCGGCSLQHLTLASQIANKQRALEDNLRRLGKIKVEQIMSPIYGLEWQYRQRTKLSVACKPKSTTKIKLGFKQKNTQQIIDLQQCPTLPKQLVNLLPELRSILSQLGCAEKITKLDIVINQGQIHLALAKDIRLTPQDIKLLTSTSSKLAITWWSYQQNKQLLPLNITPTTDLTQILNYQFQQYNLVYPFKPNDFTQVNSVMNELLVNRAIQLLQPQKTEIIMDWFCGIGNFTLPIASLAKQVIGIEGNKELVNRAQSNFQLNQRLTKNSLCPTKFIQRDIFTLSANKLTQDTQADKWLLDPPRDGAKELCLALAQLNPQATPKWSAPRRIVYVSCNPATLARDAGILVNQAGYVCRQAGIINMFTHTAHIESIALFDLKTKNAT